MSDHKEFCELLDDHIHNEKLWRTEGAEGVKNLCKVVRALGYKNFQNFGQFEGACYGDLIDFLEDNSGAVEVIIEWIKDKGGNDDWENNLRPLVEDDEDDEDDEVQ